MLTQQELILPKQYLDKFETFKGKPFWIEDELEHERQFFETKGECCFNHIVGLPTKEDGSKHPIFDYEIKLFKAMFDPNNKQKLNRHKRQWIKKARGLGITEYFMRLVAWMCLYSDKYRGQQVMIITGPRIQIAKDLIRRFKNLFFWKLGIILPYNETVLFLNGVRICAYPSHTTASYRGQEKVFFIMIDEADFFPKSIQRQVRDVLQGYFPKSNPYVGMWSTPNEPYGLFYNIETESDEKCQYDRHQLSWKVGFKKIFSEDDIQTAKLDPITFKREFDLEYAFGLGRIFSQAVIDMVKRYGLLFRPKEGNYDPINISKNTQKVLSVDPGWGSSGTGIIVTEFLPEFNCSRVIYAKKLIDEDYDSTLELCVKLIDDYWISHIMVDGNHPGFIRALKNRIGEDSRDSKLDEIKALAKKMRKSLMDYMRVVPIVNTYKSRELLSHAKSLTETEGYMAIDPDFFGDLIKDLETGTAQDGKLIKDEEDTKDMFDSYMYNCQYYRPRLQKSQ